MRVPLRVFLGIFCCLSVFVDSGICTAVAQPHNLTLAEMPKCGVSCFLQNINGSACGIKDVHCQCTNGEYKRSLIPCILAQCKMDEMIIKQQLCGLKTESKSRETILYCTISYTVAIITVSLRIWAKFITRCFTWDDLIIVGVILLTALPLGCVIKMSTIGFGEHIWNITDGKTFSHILHLFWVSGTTYIIVLGAIKVSLCLLYIKIFPGVQRRVVTYTIMAFIIVSDVILYLVWLFMCNPVRGYWHIDIGAKCLSMNAIAFAVSIFAIIEDILLLIWPLICVWNLDLSRQRKFVVGVMITIGAFGCITTILRLHTLMSFRTTLDPTWDFVSITNWTTMELLSGLFCVSLPAIRLLFTHLVSKGLFTCFTSGLHHPKPSTRRASFTRRPEKNISSWSYHPTNKTDSTMATRTASPRPYQPRVWPRTSHIQSFSRSSHLRLTTTSRHGKAKTNSKVYDLSGIKTETLPVPPSPVSMTHSSPVLGTASPIYSPSPGIELQPPIYGYESSPSPHPSIRHPSSQLSSPQTSLPLKYQYQYQYQQPPSFSPFYHSQTHHHAHPPSPSPHFTHPSSPLITLQQPLKPPYHLPPPGPHTIPLPNPPSPPHHQYQPQYQTPQHPIFHYPTYTPAPTPSSPHSSLSASLSPPHPPPLQPRRPTTSSIGTRTPRVCCSCGSEQLLALPEMCGEHGGCCYAGYAGYGGEEEEEGEVFELSEHGDGVRRSWGMREGGDELDREEVEEDEEEEVVVAFCRGGDRRFGVVVV